MLHAEGHQCMDKETYYQQGMLHDLALLSVGYFGTSPDGNCFFNAVAQCQSGLSAVQIRQSPGSGQERHSYLRNCAAVALQQSDQHCQDLVARDATFIRSTYPEVKSMHPDLPLACAFGLAIKRDKSWVGGWCIKALAVTLGVNIVVLGSNALQLYTKSYSDSRGWETSPYIQYPRQQTRRTVGKQVPAEVLDPDTCFMVYNGKDHFWAALRSNAGLTTAQLQARFGAASIDFANTEFGKV